MKKLMIALMLSLMLVTILATVASAGDPTYQLWLPLVTKKLDFAATGSIYGWPWLTWEDWTMPWSHQESVVFLIDSSDNCVGPDGESANCIITQVTNGSYRFDGLLPANSPYTLVGLTYVPLESPTLFGQSITDISITTGDLIMVNVVMTDPPSW